MKCLCCPNDAYVTVQLAEGPQGWKHNQTPRLYIPNDHVRANVDMHGSVEEIPFCKTCMRVIEDNFRATVLYLQAENKQVLIQEA